MNTEIEQDFQDMFGEFDGRFYFTNWTKDDFVHLWNNKEYFFPAEKTVPLVIMGEPLENIQEIRKRFAYDLADREWYKSAEYKKMMKMGNGLPPTRNDTVLEPLIEKALTPLPLAKATVREGKRVTHKFKATKAIGDGDNPNFIFAEENKNPPKLGKMSDR